MCSAWLTFEAFLRDVGPSPSPLHSLDRLNNEGDYEPANVRWVTKRTQNQNTRTCKYYTLNGERLCIAEWARRKHLPYAKVKARLRRGWSIEKALDGGS